MLFHPAARKSPMADFGRRTALAALWGMLALPAFAQYQVHQWLNFEQGSVPDSAIRIAKDPSQTVQVLPLEEVGKTLAGFRSPQVARETGRQGLVLRARPVEKDFLTVNSGLAAPEILDRDRLGEKGRALFQADFFLPAEGDLPSLAVLAMEPPENAVNGTVPNVQKPFYRFGLTLGKTVYFSYIQNKQVALFQDDKEFLKQIPRPGWHRFAIVMEGSDTIRCYVDGREPKFSPIREPSLRKLVVGVMLAEPKRTYDAYVDNLSVQVSEDAPILPQSPYREGWTVETASSTRGRGGESGAALPSAAELAQAGWLEPVEAWEKARKEQKPLLLYFHAPGLRGTAAMDRIFATDKGAREFLGRHVAARVDVNQLEGGTVARQYEVYKVPTLLVISPDAKAYKRVVPRLEDTWQALSSQLTLR